MFRRILVGASMLLLLTGCATAGAAPMASPTPTPTAPPATLAGPEIPTQSAELQPVVAVSPPTRVQIPSVGVDIPVEPVGVEADGQMTIPENIRTAGWYQYGPNPASETGSTVITAHVDSRVQGIGPFAYLRDAAAGAEVIVTTADGVDHRYTLQSVESLPKQQVPLDRIFDRVGAPQLVLVTCGGSFDESTRIYSDNVLGVAIPVA